ncbi:S-adenosylmethionine synthase [Dirofilaria immitis]
MGFFISDSFLSFGLFCHFILLHVIILLCKTKNKQKMDETTLQNANVILNQAIISKQPLPSNAVPTSTNTIDKITLKQPSTKPIESKTTAKMIPEKHVERSTVKQKSMNEKFGINRTQSETEFEEISLKTSLRINQTQGSISQRMDDSADTGEYVSDLPEDREHSSDE